ncbi:hypothetical protein [Streptomyces gelaticus]|uniref:hypothetical protein n=1 Tax=Streptomyces gelaticus TaxID=285446 RepID=UPI0016741212
MSKRPRAPVLGALRAARSGTPDPACRMVNLLGDRSPSLSRTASRVTAVAFVPGPLSTLTPSPVNCPATALRHHACRNSTDSHLDING